MEPYDWTDLLTGEFPKLYTDGFQTGAEPTSHELSISHATQPSRGRTVPGGTRQPHSSRYRQRVDEWLANTRALAQMRFFLVSQIPQEVRPTIVGGGN